MENFESKENEIEKTDDLTASVRKEILDLHLKNLRAKENNEKKYEPHLADLNPDMVDADFAAIWDACKNIKTEEDLDAVKLAFDKYKKDHYYDSGRSDLIGLLGNAINMKYAKFILGEHEI